MYLCVLPPVKINCSSIKMDSPYFLSSLITRSQHSLSHLLYLISVCRCTTESWMQHRYYIKMYCYLRCNKTSLRCLWCADVLLESLPQQNVTVIKELFLRSVLTELAVPRSSAFLEENMPSSFDIRVCFQSDVCLPLLEMRSLSRINRYVEPCIWWFVISRPGKLMGVHQILKVLMYYICKCSYFI